ncbi:MAG: glycoside hydrolase family 13 protein [Bacteroidales bacterium]
MKPRVKKTATKSLISIKCLIGLMLLLAAGCRQIADRKLTEKELMSVPEWSKHAIWYQIFVERFRNGDTLNDPTPEDMKGGYPDNYPSDWKITPWGHDWYAHEPWLEEIKAGGFYSKIQARRYGGDLQGVLDEMDYLSSLGITAVYFNPLNDSPSLHKYDARTYTHIDRNFGPDPKGDAILMKREIPDDPKTWTWTAADKLFLKVVDEFHKRGIRVILDYSWNHTGKDFWALEDIRKNGERSKFAGWYNIIHFDNPETAADEFEYEGWGGKNKYMPVFKKDIIPPDNKVMPFEGNFHSESLKQYIFNVTRRWLDPNNDGDPSDGIDGFRLDVAAEVPMGFWREYRKVVRSVNPRAYLVGEIWWLEWPGKLLDPAQFMGTQFDAIMNYRWYRLARGFFGQAEPVLNATGFVKGIEMINKGISTENQQAMMNVAATHDSPRVSTSLYNKTMDKFHATPAADTGYRINRPDAKTMEEEKLLLVHQYTFVGSPHIWNGDEIGMWGADDPDCRKPMVWGDIRYDDERANYRPGKYRPVDKVYPDTVLLSFYRSLIKLRKDNPVLSTGDLKFLIADDSKMVLAYSRRDEKDEIIAVFNRSSLEQILSVPLLCGTGYREIFPKEGEMFKAGTSGLEIRLKPLTSIVLKRVRN